MNQLPFKTEKGNYLCIEVPPNPKDIVVNGNQLDFVSGKFWHTETLDVDGTWLIVGLLSDITDDRAKEIVDETDNPFWIGQGLKYIDFTSDINCFETALESFKSLLKAHGIDQDKHYLILKQG